MHLKCTLTINDRFSTPCLPKNTVTVCGRAHSDNRRVDKVFRLMTAVPTATGRSLSGKVRVLTASQLEVVVDTCF